MQKPHETIQINLKGTGKYDDLSYVGFDSTFFIYEGYEAMSGRPVEITVTDGSGDVWFSYRDENIVHWHDGGVVDIK